MLGFFMNLTCVVLRPVVCSLYCSVFIMFLLFPIQATATPTLLWCLNHLPPRQIYQNTANPSGPMVDFMQELAERSGFELSYSPPMPNTRCLKQMEHGTADLMSGLLYKPERAEYMEFLQLDTAKTDVLFAHKNQTFDSEQQVLKRKIAMAQNNKYSSDFLSNLQKAEVEVVWVNDMDAALALLALKEVELAAGSMHLTQLLITQNSRFKSSLLLNTWQFSTKAPEYIYLTMSKQSQHANLLPKIKQQLQQMQSEGKINFYNEGPAAAAQSK